MKNERRNRTEARPSVLHPIDQAIGEGRLCLQNRGGVRKEGTFAFPNAKGGLRVVSDAEIGELAKKSAMHLKDVFQSGEI